MIQNLVIEVIGHSIEALTNVKVYLLQHKIFNFLSFGFNFWKLVSFPK